MGGQFDAGVEAAGRYEIVRFIAAGGMGEVYAARDKVLDTEVALKTLKPELEGSSVALARSVTDPHVCRMYDVGEHAGRVFLTMELLDGKSLEAPLPLDRPEAIARQLVRGLAALHRAGVVHRDFKTSNIIGPMPARRSSGSTRSRASSTKPSESARRCSPRTSLSGNRASSRSRDRERYIVRRLSTDR